MTEKKKSVLLLRLEMPRWPLEEGAFKNFFQDLATKCKFDQGAFAGRLAHVVSKFIEDQLENPLRKEGDQVKSTTEDTIAAMASVSPPDCWYDHTTWEVLVDDDGNTFIRECQHHVCEDGTSYMTCEDYPA